MGISRCSQVVGQGFILPFSPPWGAVDMQLVALPSPAVDGTLFLPSNCGVRHLQVPLEGASTISMALDTARLYGHVRAIYTANARSRWGHALPANDDQSGPRVTCWYVYLTQVLTPGIG